jgi:hypothetical protein
MLESIIRFAEPTSQLNSFRVSVSWQSNPKYIINQSYRTPYPCLPVEHGQLLDPSLDRLRPTQNEFEDANALILLLPNMEIYEALRHFVSTDLPNAWVSINCHMKSPNRYNAIS